MPWRFGFVSVLAVLILAGCVTLDHPEVLAPLQKVALVEVRVVDSVPGDGDPTATSREDLARGFGEIPGKLVDHGESLITNALKGAWGDGVIAKNVVMSAPAYQGLSFPSFGYVRASGYRPLSNVEVMGRITDPTNLKKIAADLAADALVTVEFRPGYSSTQDLFAGRVRVPNTQMVVTFYGADGKVLAQPYYFGNAPGVSGNDVEDLAAGFRVAMAGVVEAFKRDLAKR